MLVVSGSNNLFVVRADDGSELSCRIKGKVLKGAEGFYNPIAPGDRVEVDPSGCPPGEGLVTALEPRRNRYARWNQKGRAPQLLAANLDLLVCVATPALPPFRPRFVDRALVQADAAGIPAAIAVNKSDLEPDDPDVEERLLDFERLGFRVLRVSASTGAGLDELRDLFGGKTVALVGQSGVGKSSLLNALAPGLDLRTGDLCAKFERGAHTTTMARMVRVEAPRGGAWVVDTPGVRRLSPDGVAVEDLALHMPEFAPLLGTCSYGLSCSHEREPGCRIMEAVAAGVIHEDRYESFLRMREELSGRAPAWERDR